MLNNDSRIDELYETYSSGDTNDNNINIPPIGTQIHQMLSSGVHGKP